MSSAGNELDQVRQIALRRPGVNERYSHGAPCFFVRDRRPLCYVHDHHRGDSRVTLWVPAAPGVQDELVTAEPDRFIRPTPSAAGTFSQWLGVHLDQQGHTEVDWQEIAAILEEAYRLIAPKTLIAELDSQPPPIP